MADIPHEFDVVEEPDIILPASTFRSLNAEINTLRMQLAEARAALKAEREGRLMLADDTMGRRESRANNHGHPRSQDRGRVK